MKHLHRHLWLLAVLAVLAVLLLCVGCGPVDETPDDPGEIVVEPGLLDDQTTPDEDSETGEDENQPEDEGPKFVDNGEASTVDDLVANLALVESYYFEQDIPYVDGHVFMQIWYKDGRMKVVTSVDGYGLSEYYYDYNQKTVINYAPGESGPAMKLSFDAASEDAPDNPKLRDYASCTENGFETIGQQTCMVLTDTDGSTIWVSTANGFPKQVYYEDSMGDVWTVQYKNLRLNEVRDADLDLDPTVEVVDYSGR